MMLYRAIKRMPRLGCALLVLLVAVIGAGVFGAVMLAGRGRSNSPEAIGRWFDDPTSRAGLMTVMAGAACPEAPFILPSDGLVGLLWGDPVAPYTIFNPHSGIDIFGN